MLKQVDDRMSGTGEGFELQSEAACFSLAEWQPRNCRHACLCLQLSWLSRIFPVRGLQAVEVNQ